MSLPTQSLHGMPLLVRITYVRCGKHTFPGVRTTLKALGLNRLHQSVVHKNILPIRGMINKVKHYIDVEPIYYKGPRTQQNVSINKEE